MENRLYILLSQIWQAVAQAVTIMSVVDDLRALLVFVQIGIVITIFALSKLHESQEGVEKIESLLEQRVLISSTQRRAIQARRKFLQLLQAMTTSGNFYFAAALFLLIALTYDSPDGVGRVATQQGLGSFYFLLVNGAFVCVLIATAYNAWAYISYRVFKFRLH